MQAGLQEVYDYVELAKDELQGYVELAKGHYLFDSFLSETAAVRYCDFGSVAGYTLQDLTDFAAFCFKKGEDAPYPIFDLLKKVEAFDGKALKAEPEKDEKVEAKEEKSQPPPCDEAADNDTQTQSPSCDDQELSAYLQAAAAEEHEEKTKEEETVETKNSGTQTIRFGFMIKEADANPEEVDERQIARDARAAFQAQRKKQEEEEVTNDHH